MTARRSTLGSCSRPGAAVLVVLVLGVAGCGGDTADNAAPVSASALPSAVRSVPAAPIEGRMSHIAVWSGAEMIIWGGVGQGPDAEAPYELADGAAYDPELDTWRRLPPAPLSARVGSAATWAGDRLVVWGGATWSGISTLAVADGAEYDPMTDAWTALPPAGITGRVGAHAEWTGTEVLVWGGSTSLSNELQLSDGAAYDPASRTWRRIPAAPLPDFYEHGAVWTGSELIVLAGTYDESARGPLGAAYDPATDAWRELADSPLAQGYALDLVWDGDRVLSVYPVTEEFTGGDVNPFPGSRTASAAYEPASDTWERLPLSPESVSSSTSAWTGGAVAFWAATPDGGAAYLVADQRWVQLPAVDGPYREFPSVVWTGEELIAWGGNDNCEAYGVGGAADCVLSLLADGFALRAKGLGSDRPAP